MFMIQYNVNILQATLAYETWAVVPKSNKVYTAKQKPEAKHKLLLNWK